MWVSESASEEMCVGRGSMGEGDGWVILVIGDMREGVSS